MKERRKSEIEGKSMIHMESGDVSEKRNTPFKLDQMHVYSLTLFCQIFKKDGINSKGARSQGETERCVDSHQMSYEIS